MPIVVQKPPKNLRPYTFHGVNLEWEAAVQNGDDNVNGDCPFCGREGKFVVSIETGQSRCFVCGISGKEGGSGLNHQTFIRKLWEKSYEETKLDDYEKLSESRGVRFPETLMRFELALSCINNNWLVPGYSKNKRMTQLYRYLRLKGKDGVWKNKCLQTPEMGSKLFGLCVWNNPLTVYVCEGPWDTIVLYESLDAEGMAEESTVIGVPGTNTFREEWAEMFSGLNVKICFDNDHPEENGRVGSVEGIKRMASIMDSIDIPPAKIEYIKWGEEGYSMELDNGFDVSDLLTNREML